MPLFGFGKDNTFYDLLEARADAAHRAALAFQVLVGDFANVAAHARQIEQIEIFRLAGLH